MADKIEFTPEQKEELVTFFQNNDFTVNMAIDREYNMKSEDVKVFLKAKKIFGEYWLGNLRSLGVKRKMKNFSKETPICLVNSLSLL